MQKDQMTTFTNNKKGQYKLHNIDAVKNKPIKNYINILIVAA